MASQRSESVPVVIIGGSLVGLSAALCLAAQNVKSIILERHPGSSPHPRALGFTPRTMEIYRALGFQSRIKEADPNFKLLRARVESLAGKHHEVLPWTENQEAANPLDYSISAGAAIPQDELEEILRSEARSRSQIELRYSSTLVSVKQDDEQVISTVKMQDGQQYEIRSSYMIAADGNRSHIRQELGIERGGEKEGKGSMGVIDSVMFRAELEEYLKDGVAQFNIDQPDMKAFMTHYLDGRWALMFTDGKERSPEEQKEAIYKAIGRPDIEIEILTTGRWTLSMLIADHFRSGRVFLAGDAAHTLPPNRGGYGANTGIGDAWNLAWKLGAVLSRASREELLDTYETERRAIALLRKEQILQRRDYKAHIKTESGEGQVLDEVAMEVGEIYRSKAVLGAGDDLPAARRPDEWNGQPGTRAAHLWMTRDGERISSLDLFGREWVLLSESPEWMEAAATANQGARVQVTPVQVGSRVLPEDLPAWRKLMGIPAEGATLIRPDGIIAWRQEGGVGNAAEALRDALRQVAMPAEH